MGLSDVGIEGAVGVLDECRGVEVVREILVDTEWVDSGVGDLWNDAYGGQGCNSNIDSGQEGKSWLQNDVLASYCDTSSV